MADRKYRFYLKRNDTHQNIGDEDILVGNRANVGKYTSGLTRGSQYSYVEFTWNELLRAVDATPDPTISLSASTTTVPKSGGTVTVTITVNNGVYDRYEIMPAAQVIVTNPNPSTAILTITIGEDTRGEDIDYDVVGYGRSEDGTKTCSNSVSFTQYWTWALADVDYVVFTYNWGGNDGRDLDSVTFIDGLATSSTGDYGYTFERGVGWGNGSGAPGTDGEMYIGETTDLGNALLRFAGDNQQNGNEYTLINFNKLNETITEGVREGKIDRNSKVIVYLMGSWYGERYNGNASVSFTAYKGGSVSRVKWEGDTAYRYVINNYEEIKGSHTETGLNTFAKEKPISNHMFALKAYSTLAAFVYDYMHNKFSLVVGDELRALDGGKRFSGGLQSVITGNTKVYLNGTLVYDENFSPSPTIEIQSPDTSQTRSYQVVFGSSLISTSGTSQSSTETTSPIILDPDSIKTVSSGSADYDGEIILSDRSQTGVTVTFPAGHVYSGARQWGYPVSYTIQPNDEFLGLFKESNYLSFDLKEKF